ncbi:MAG: type I glutamate--ammonia ligase [Halanaerobiales bacterium]|nr:type I glutamate--ammonia ligase [Halanaerobiales bacterium]
MFDSYNQLKKYVKKNNVKTLDFKIPQLNGNWKHLSVTANNLRPEIFTEGFGFDGSNYGYANVETSDMVFKPDFRTAFPDPFWEEKTLAFLGNIYEVNDSGDIPFKGESRNILLNSLEYMRYNDHADQFVLGPEFEYYIFDEIYFWNQNHNSGFNVYSRQAEWDRDNYDGFKINPKEGYHADAPHDRFRDLRSAITLALEDIDIKVKYHHHEVGGPGQHEIETERVEAAKMADDTIKIKYFIKNMAVKHGKTATFMPKPLYGEAGNGFHVHMQLFKDGNSIFSSQNDNYANLSQKAFYFMGGILKHTPALMGLAAPSTNSYKRLVNGYEAPVAICFSKANRSAVIRIPGYATKPEDRRFEFRPGDASGNSYLTYASLLMAGLDGIEQKIDPIELGYGPIDENIYDLSPQKKADLEFLPKDLEEAIEALENDHEFLLKGDVFSKNVIEAWLESKKRECQYIYNRPTPDEYKLYFDV